jgi:amino acid transporter
VKLDWVLVFAAPITWFVAHVGNWMVAPGAHDVRSLWRLGLIDAVAAVVVVSALAASIVRLRANREDERRQFLLLGAVGVSALVLLLMIAMALPTLMLPAGAEP